MGLEAFKTDGPRTYDKNSSSSASTECIHIVNGMDQTEYGFLRRHETHTAYKVPESLNIALPGGPPYFICSDCGKVSQTYDSMLKSDLVDYKDHDWVIDALNDLLSDFESTPKEEYYDGTIEEIEVDSNNADDSEKKTSRSQSSSTDKDFNSGLDSFLS